MVLFAYPGWIGGKITAPLKRLSGHKVSSSQLVMGDPHLARNLLHKLCLFTIFLFGEWATGSYIYYLLNLFLFLFFLFFCFFCFFLFFVFCFLLLFFLGFFVVVFCCCFFGFFLDIVLINVPIASVAISVCGYGLNNANG